jgi:peptidoglycan/LPS O-acetylase OafA/YrhL
LKIEIGFYLIVPAIVVATKRWGWGVLALTFVVSVAYSLLALHMRDIRLARQLPGQLQFFVAGMALYLYGVRLRIPPLASVAIAVAFLVAWSVFDPIPAGIRPVLVAAFVYSFALCLPVIRLRTDISYSVYLLHGPLIQTLILLGLFRDTMPFLAGVVATVIAAAVVTERLVERPGTAFGRRLSSRLAGRRPAVAGLA